jgi:hypothetical protein
VEAPSIPSSAKKFWSGNAQSAESAGIAKPRAAQTARSHER